MTFKLTGRTRKELLSCLKPDVRAMVDHYLNDNELLVVVKQLYHWQTCPMTEWIRDGQGTSSCLMRLSPSLTHYQ